MAHAHFHAVSSVRQFGGVVEDYIEIHNFFDSSKEHCADARHRMLLHSTFGITIAEKVFGQTITNSAGRVVPVAIICEQHILEDLGHIPTVNEWFTMCEVALPTGAYVKARKLSKEFS